MIPILMQEEKKVYENCGCSQADLIPEACPAENSCSTRKWIVFVIQQFFGVLIFFSHYPALNVAYLRSAELFDKTKTLYENQGFVNEILF